MKDVVEWNCQSQLDPADDNGPDDEAAKHPEGDGDAGTAGQRQDIDGLGEDAACNGPVHDQAEDCKPSQQLLRRRGDTEALSSVHGQQTFLFGLDYAMKSGLTCFSGL